MSIRLLSLLKKIPIDFAQGSVAERTKGKKIAMSLVPPADPGEGRTALDVGCRKGVQSRWLESQGYQVTAIDVEKGYEKGIVADANERLPFPDASFDLLWCSEVIEHLEQPENAVEEFLRVVKDDGNIVITTPNSHFWFFRLLSVFGIPPQKIQRPDHLHFFSIREMLKLFPGAEMYGFFPYMGIKLTIRQYAMINFLSPTFVIHLKKRHF